MKYQLRLGRQRQVWLILLADEMQGVQVKLCYPLTIPKRLRDVSCRGAIQNDYINLFLPLTILIIKFLQHYMVVTIWSLYALMSAWAVILLQQEKMKLAIADNQN